MSIFEYVRRRREESQRSVNIEPRYLGSHGIPGFRGSRTQNQTGNSETRNLRPDASPGVYSAKRTLHHLDLFCDAPKAESVTLAGDFNGWDSTANPMHRLPDGRWMASLELCHGHHQYLFVVDGAYKLDPNACGIVRNERNEPVSLIAIS